MKCARYSTNGVQVVIWLKLLQLYVVRFFWLYIETFNDMWRVFFSHGAFLWAITVVSCNLMTYLRKRVGIINVSRNWRVVFTSVISQKMENWSILYVNEIPVTFSRFRGVEFLESIKSRLVTRFYESGIRFY